MIHTFEGLIHTLIFMVFFFIKLSMYYEFQFVIMINQSSVNETGLFHMQRKKKKCRGICEFQTQFVPSTIRGLKYRRVFRSHLGIRPISCLTFGSRKQMKGSQGWDQYVCF